MRNGKVIESLVWKRDDGLKASIYGACPWQSQAEKARWTLVPQGFTIQWSDGTVGCGRKPFTTAEDAQRFLDHQA